MRSQRPGGDAPATEQPYIVTGNLVVFGEGRKGLGGFPPERRNRPRVSDGNRFLDQSKPVGAQFR